MEVLLYLGLAVIYFVPAALAVFFSSKRAAAIFILNLFLGWTVLGWIGALVWAFADNTNQKQNLRRE